MDLFRFFRMIVFGAFTLFLPAQDNPLAQVTRLASPTQANPASSGWTVDPGLGGLQVSLPIAAVPGEIPIAMAFTMNASLGGAFQSGHTGPPEGTGIYPNTVYLQPISGTCGFGYISSSQLEVYRYLALETGEVFSATEFSAPTGTWGNALLAAYGIIPAPTFTVSSDGSMLWAIQTVPGGTAFPLPNGVNSLNYLPDGFPVADTRTYEVVASKNLLHVYVQTTMDGKNVAVPILWADRFGHYVTFKWIQQTANLPPGVTSIVRVDALNQRSQGVTLRYANWADTTSIHDLARVDLVGLAGPVTLIQGYSGCANLVPASMVMPNPTGYGTNVNVNPTFRDVVGGLVARPTTQTSGDPSEVPEPSWNGSAPGTAPIPYPAGSLGPTPAPLVWHISYDPASLAEIANLTDPRFVLTTFSYQTYLQVTGGYHPHVLRGVTQTVETDTSQPSPAVRTKIWSRTLPIIGVNYAWPATYQEYWSSVGSPDSTTQYNYAELYYHWTDYSNGVLQSVSLVEAGTGITWSSATYATTSIGGAMAVGASGGGLDKSLSRPFSVTTTSRFENDRKVTYAYQDTPTCLQPKTVSSQVSLNGDFYNYETRELTYNDKTLMLET